jgi:phospholipid transport system substrate-binding protein
VKPVAFIKIFLFLTVLGLPYLSFGSQPLEVLQQGVNEGIRILQDPLFQDTTRKNIGRQKLFEITRRIFDFEEFSRRVLASHWKKFTPQQRKEFVDVFSDFLGKFYLSKLQEKYMNEKVIFLNQEITGNARALVNIKVLWRDLAVPVKIRMLKRKGAWKAYDLSVLGISAVKNYRAQFKMILRKESPQQVIDRLKKKIAGI